MSLTTFDPNLDEPEKSAARNYPGPERIESWQRAWQRPAPARPKPAQRKAWLSDLAEFALAAVLTTAALGILLVGMQPS